MALPLGAVPGTFSWPVEMPPFWTWFVDQCHLSCVKRFWADVLSCFTKPDNVECFHGSRDTGWVDICNMKYGLMGQVMKHYSEHVRQAWPFLPWHRLLLGACTVHTASEPCHTGSGICPESKTCPKNLGLTVELSWINWRSQIRKQRDKRCRMMDEIMEAQHNGMLIEMRKASEDPRVIEAGAEEPLIMLKAHCWEKRNAKLTKGSEGGQPQ